MSVRLINCFEIPEGRDDDFLAHWHEVNSYMKEKPGYLAHRLHRSIAPGVRYRFVNYVEWESAQHLADAHADPGFRALVGAPGWSDFTSTRAIYEIIDGANAP